MDSAKKKERYCRVYKQLNELLKPTPDICARMATISSILYHKFDYFFWTGFYLLKDGQLTVGPYQGSLACLILEKNKGVCWAGINERKTIIVPNVHEFSGHIACDSRSNSEIVIPVFNVNDCIIGVLDIDSKDFDAFNDIDRFELEKIVQLIY
ncbi:MAG: GAF domain-containing protein [Bacteroidota bacterium]